MAEEASAYSGAAALGAHKRNYRNPPSDRSAQCPATAPLLADNRALYRAGISRDF